MQPEGAQDQDGPSSPDIAASAHVPASAEPENADSEKTEDPTSVACRDAPDDQDDGVDRTADARPSHDAESDFAVDEEPLADVTGGRADQIAPAPDGADPDHPSTFADLIATACLADESSDATAELLALLDVPPFTGFDSGPGTQPTPAFHCALNASHLARALKLLEFCTRKGQRLGTLRLSVERNVIKAQGFYDAFFELHMQPSFVHGISEHASAVLFIRGEDLRVANTAFESEVEFRYVPAVPVLHVSSKNFERPLLLADPASFTFINERNIGSLDLDAKQKMPRLLSRGIQYVLPHVDDDPVRESFSVIDCKDGMVVGGSSHIIARFRAPALDGIDFCFKRQDAAIVSLVLDSLDDVFKHSSDYFSVLRTSNLFVGIPKSGHRSPILKLQIAPDVTQKLIVGRQGLLDRLERVEHALGRTSVHLRTKGVLNTKLAISGSADDRTTIRDFLDAHSTFDRFNLRVDTELLNRAVEKDQSSNVVLNRAPSALIIDDSDGAYEAITAISESNNKTDRETLHTEAYDDSVSSNDA